MPSLSSSVAFLTTLNPVSRLPRLPRLPLLERFPLRLQPRTPRATRFSISLSAGGRNIATSPPSVTVSLPHAAHTAHLASLLASDAQPADALLLHAPLGCGKTFFAASYIRSLLNDPSLSVSSPTYLLANVYPLPRSPLRVFHIDLWRLSSAASRPVVDFPLVFAKHIALIEWPDRLEPHLLPPDRLHIFLDFHPHQPSTHDTSDDDPWGFEAALAHPRLARLQPVGPQWTRRISRLTSTYFTKPPSSSSSSLSPSPIYHLRSPVPNSAYPPSADASPGD